LFVHFSALKQALSAESKTRILRPRPKT